MSDVLLPLSEDALQNMHEVSYLWNKYFQTWVNVLDILPMVNDMQNVNKMLIYLKLNVYLLNTAFIIVVDQVTWPCNFAPCV